MKKYLLILLLSIFLIGCIFRDAPQNNSNFSENTKINNLVGMYKNLGDDGINDNINKYLSELIWPHDKSLQHESINIISVKKKDNKSLIVKAMNKDLIIKEQLFTEGKEFKIDDGIIILANKTEILGTKSGEVAVGLSSYKNTIGLDKNGDGKYQSSSAAGALLLLVIPIAIHGKQEIRFKRLE